MMVAMGLCGRAGNVFPVDPAYVDVAIAADDRFLSKLCMLASPCAFGGAHELMAIRKETLWLVSNVAGSSVSHVSARTGALSHMSHG